VTHSRGVGLLMTICLPLKKPLESCDKPLPTTTHNVQVSLISVTQNRVSGSDSVCLYTSVAKISRERTGYHFGAIPRSPCRTRKSQIRHMFLGDHHVKSDSAPGKARIDSLTGLRTLAAAWVVIFHFKDEITKFFPHLPSPLFHFVNTGWLGVDVFFVLSGFVISYNYATTFATFNAPTYWRYLWLRLARIYPLHLAVLAAYGLLLVLANLGFGNINNPNDFSISSLLTYLLLIQAWGFGIEGWNKPAWSITAEWFAYLTFPITRSLTARLNTTGLLTCSVLALIIVPLVGANATGTAEHFINLTRIICEFTTGCCLYWLHEKRVGEHWHWPSITVVALLAVPVVAMACSAAGVIPYWATLPIGLLVYALTQARGVLATWMASKSMVFWGQVSYAVYLTHLLTRSLMTRVLKPERFLEAGLPIKIAVLLAFAAGIAAVATVAYLFLEEPARKWMRQRYDQVMGLNKSRVSVKTR
jgi:peptidoglycan/LPS O-acetylase OafA/YrhL